MTTIRLSTYDVHIERGLIDRAADVSETLRQAHRCVIISDERVGGIYAERVLAGSSCAESLVLLVPEGEGSKTREQWSALTDRMLDAGVGRDSVVLALGGGMIGDLAGFVAATYMRGIPLVHMPTSLLAMVDASIGGKTAVDTPAGKNLVGSFHEPSAVLIDPLLLATLPDRDLRAGSAEVVKHGAIADAAHFADAQRLLPGLLGDPEDARWSELIARSIAIKASVVEKDPRERDLRKILNFGHTLGHALESSSGFELRHGEAVAIGMALESRIAERMGIAERGTAERIRESVAATGLPWERPATLKPDVVLEATRADKKSRRGAPEYALPARIGAMAGGDSGWTVRVPDEMVREILE